MGFPSLSPCLMKGVRTCEALKGSLTLHAYFANLESGLHFANPLHALGGSWD
jgi:hypothetical protein